MLEYNTIHEIHVSEVNSFHADLKVSLLKVSILTILTEFNNSVWVAYQKKEDYFFYLNTTVSDINNVLFNETTFLWRKVEKNIMKDYA